MLGQRFCDGCGTDLEAFLAKQQKQYDELLSKAVAAAKELDFETSLDLLRRVAEVDDFRFQNTAQAAAKAIARVEGLQHKTTSAAQAKIAQAMAHHQAGELSDVIKLLKDVPSKLLDEETQRIYVESAGKVEQLKSLEQEFSAASREKNWVMAGALVHQLQEALPEDRMYQKASAKIAEKLSSQARQLFDAQKYPAAATRLEAIPPQSLTPESEKLRQTIQDAQWLQRVLETETFASPTLGRLAVRLTKLLPEDPGPPNVVKELSTVLKESKRHPRCHLPSWKGSKEAWTGGEAQLFTRPTQINFDESNELVRSKLGRFHVAMGLAIQGLKTVSGAPCRVDDELSMQKKKKSLFAKKKVQPCWGIDIGSQSVKAVRMEIVGEKFLATDWFYQDLESSGVTAGGQQNSYDQVQPAINSLKKISSLDECLIWVNLPGSEITTRFVRLPPVDDKKAKEMVDLEISNRIPVPMDELVVTRTLGEHHAESSHGRPLVFSAARRTAVQRRMELMQQVGLKVDGMQADPLAIVNLIDVEFADVLTPVADPETESEPGPQADDKKKRKWGKKEVGAKARFDEKTPAVCWVDAGAKSTTLVYVSGETHWFWTVENGGDSLTSALARSTKQTHHEADALKIQPENLTSPAEHYEPVENRMDELRSRLIKVADDAMKQNVRFDVIETYAAGGTSLAIGWMPRLLGTSK